MAINGVEDDIAVHVVSFDPVSTQNGRVIVFSILGDLGQVCRDTMPWLSRIIGLLKFRHTLYIS